MNYKINNYAKATFENFQKFRQDGNYCDVDIISGNTVVKAHRVVLSAGCQYFKAMFDAGLNECQTGRVNLSTIPYNVLESIVNFIYTGKIYISSSNAQLLMSAAHFLLLENLVNCCSQYLKTQLHPSNAIGIFRFAEAHNCTNLAQFAWDYIQVHWFSFAEMEEFLDLPFQLLMKLLSSDKLLTEDEDEVLHVALHWLKHDLPLRRQHCIEVLQRVHIHQLKPQAFEDALKNIKDPYIAKILNMLREKRAKDLPTALPPSRRRPRNLYVVGGLTRDVNQDITLNTILRYDACNRFWEKLAPMQSPRVSHGVVAVGGKLYAVGGSDGLETLSSGEVYDIAIGKWSHIAPMKKARKWFGLAALNRKLYAFGGLVDGRMDSTIEVYDPVSNVWSLIGDMPEPRWATKAITYEGAIYLVGGRAQNNYRTRNLLRYQPGAETEGTWCRLRSMIQSRDFAAVTVFKSRLYVIGGNGDAVERYDFITGKWECVCFMEYPREGIAAGPAGDALLVAGGFSKCKYFSSVYLFDARTNRWSDGPSMLERRAYAGTALL